MTLRRFAAAVLATLLVACGGSGSETPPPVEPTSPVSSARETERPTAESIEAEGTTEAEPAAPQAEPDAE